MLSKRFGICGNPHTGYPDGTYARMTKLGWLRTLILDWASFEGMYNQMPNELNIAVVVTGQSGPLANDFWSDGWRDRYTAYITELCERFYRKVRLIEFTNEWDFWDNDDKAEKAAELAIIGTDICKKYGILGVLGSVASGDWEAQLAKAIKVIDRADKKLGYDSVHGFAFHPYASGVERTEGDTFVVPDTQPRWPRVSDKIRRAREIAKGRPVAVTEGGIKVGDAGGMDKQQLYVHGWFQDEMSQFTEDELLMATYFCWTDANGAPDERGDAAFGLVSDGGQIRPAFHAMTYQMQNAPIVDIPVSRLIRNSLPDDDQEPGDPPKPPDAPIEPPKPVQRVLTAPQAHELRWRAIVPSAVYNHDFGFERHWRHPDNAWWGSPVTESELALDDGRPLRVFANAVVAYNGGNDTTEVLQ